MFHAALNLTFESMSFTRKQMWDPENVALCAGSERFAQVSITTFSRSNSGRLSWRKEDQVGQLQLDNP